ncbi:hypothetical protein B0O99DRAFT_163409 [Bisporella sp. PMI_857]|nr:hypothetical protein B0O99DRAFT_163409 [Bisporella sp. PMI_857]
MNSRLFKFIVGKEVDGTSTEFQVHEAAVARLSGPLNSLLKREMLKAQAGCTKWDDVGKETSERLAEFAYTGSYSVPGVESLEKEVKKDKISKNDALGIFWWQAEDIFPPEDSETVTEFVHESESEPVEYNWEDNWKAPKGRKGKSKKNHQPLIERPRVQPPLETVLENEQSNILTYSTTFHAHASLYILPPYRLITPLISLSQRNLQMTLDSFQLTSSNTPDLFGLA